MLFKIKVEGLVSEELFIEALDEEAAIEQAHQELFLLDPKMFEDYTEGAFTLTILDCPNEGCYCGSCFYSS